MLGDLSFLKKGHRNVRDCVFEEAFQSLGTRFYLLYWYKSTNTDAEGAASWQQGRQNNERITLLVQKYLLTGTKVQILTRRKTLLDANKDGKITKDEFINYARRTGVHMWYIV